MSFTDAIKNLFYRLGTVENTRAVLSYAAVIGFFGILYLLFVEDVSDGATKDVLLVLLGALVAVFKDVYGYYIGSSEGSKSKTKLLAQNGNT